MSHKAAFPITLTWISDGVSAEVMFDLAHQPYAATDPINLQHAIPTGAAYPPTIDQTVTSVVLVGTVLTINLNPQTIAAAGSAVSETVFLTF